MDTPDLPRLNTELAALLRDKLRVRGPTLALALQQAGRRLPRTVRQAGQQLVAQEQLWENPRLRRQIDAAAVAAAAKALHAHLDAIETNDRRRSYWLGVLTPLAFNFLLVLALVTAWVALRG